MLYMGSFVKLFLVCDDFIQSIDSTEVNLTVKLFKKLKDIFGSWSGGPDHRGHVSSVDVITYYSDVEKHAAAISAIESFAESLENSSKLSLPDFKSLLQTLVKALPGIDLFYGQNLGLYLALGGYLRKNLHNALLAFPVEGQGSSRTIQEEDDALTAELNTLNADDSSFEFKGPMVDQMKNLGFKATVENFATTVRVVSGFVGIDSRPCWIECLFCDGIGPQDKPDHIFPNQSMFWLFKRTNKFGITTYVAKEKKANGTFYLNVINDNEID